MCGQQFRGKQSAGWCKVREEDGQCWGWPKEYGAGASKKGRGIQSPGQAIPGPAQLQAQAGLSGYIKLEHVSTR